MNLGIDFGNTICKRDDKNEFCIMNDNTLLVISELKKEFENVYIISKVNEEQKKETLDWMRENLFFLLIPYENIFFCNERVDKRDICNKLMIDVMIDDRPEVMSYLDDNILKVMIKPVIEDIDKYAIKNFVCLNSWTEVYRALMEWKY